MIQVGFDERHVIAVWAINRILVDRKRIFLGQLFEQPVLDVKALSLQQGHLAYRRVGRTNERAGHVSLTPKTAL